MSEMVDRVAVALRNNKASLSNPEAESLARAAVSAMREIPDALCEIGADAYANGDPNDYVAKSGIADAWRAVIDDVLNEKKARPPVKAAGPKLRTPLGAPSYRRQEGSADRWIRIYRSENPQSASRREVRFPRPRMFR